MNSKAPLILIPGLLCDHRIWDKQCSALSDIATISVANTRKDSSIHNMARRLLSAAPPLFSLCGLSMGGYVALEVMRLAPQRVLRLALLDTSARLDTEAQSKVRKASITALDKGVFKGVTPRLLPQIIDTSNLNNQDLTALIIDMAYHIGKTIYIQQQTAIINRCDSLPTLSNITCPTTIICGKNDQVTPLGLQEELHHAIPHSTLNIIDDCGHLPPLESPQQTNTYLREWLTTS